MSYLVVTSTQERDSFADRLMLDTCLAAIATENPDAHLEGIRPEILSKQK